MGDPRKRPTRVASQSFSHAFDSVYIAFRLVRPPDATAAEFFDDAVMRDGLADERVGSWHVRHILGRAGNQVNEATRSVAAK